MKKKMLKRFLLWTTGVLIVCTMGAYFVFDYATNYVLGSIVASDARDSTNTTDLSSSQTKEEIGVSNVPVGEGTNTNEPPVQGDKQDEVSQSATAGKAAPTGNTTSLPSKENSNGVANNGSSGQLAPQSGSGTTPPPLPPNEANITAEQTQKAQEEITLKDKTKVTSVLLSKLSASDIKLFMQMSESGVSVEEKQKAKKIILQKLTEEEYNELIAIASKLGLSSSGKSYQESLKE